MARPSVLPVVGPEAAEGSRNVPKPQQRAAGERAGWPHRGRQLLSPMPGSTRGRGRWRGGESGSGSGACSLVRCLWLACGVLAGTCAGLAVAVAVLSRRDPPAGPAQAMKDAPAAGEGGEAAAGAGSAPPGPWADSVRLTEAARPLHYSLTLHPDLGAGTFTGEVAITVAVSAPLPFLAVHAKGLDVTSTNLTRDGDQVVALRAAFEYAPRELWVLQPQAAEGEETAFAPAEYRLRMAFRGGLTRKIVGFYRSEYWDGGERRVIATSKFQPTYARQAFPCFDEPSFKSRFSVRLVRPSQEGYSALSNMNVEKEVEDEPSAGLTTVYFAESVPMVTYLACFIVSDLQRLSPVTVKPGDVPFSVYSTPSQLEKTLFARDVGSKIAEYYIKYFGIDYPLPKLDLIAIPDFVSGAMEHWGLVTFREVNLLYDSSVSSTSNKQRVTSVIAHELAHMWFGNLVTLKWWDDLWLNEGFASYMQYRGVNSTHPDWGMMDQFLVETLHPVLEMDAVLSSHPIVQHVGNPDEITELFDTISYKKGASVIRMLEAFMGEEQFRAGISNFLKKFQFKNAVTQELWEALQEVADEKRGDGSAINVTHVMDTWTRQSGYPLLTVSTDSDGNRVVTQQRFLADPGTNIEADASPYGYRWDVPITYITSDSTEVKNIWLYSNQTNVVIPDSGKTEWMKLNRHQVGYFRVNYTETEWRKFSTLLQRDIAVLDPSDRANLLDDAFSLADSGDLQYEVALEMTKYLSKETEFVPWITAVNNLRAIKQLLSGTSVYSNIMKYMRNLVKDIYSTMDWVVSENDSHAKRKLRTMVLGLACDTGLEESLDAVSREFLKWLEDTQQRPHPDLRSLIYYYGMSRSGTEKNWNIVWDLYLKEQDAQEKLKLMHGLAATHEPWLLERYIELAANESYVRSQDYFGVLTFIAQNPVGTPIVWDFLRQEWDNLVDRFTLNSRYLGRLVPGVTRYFATDFKRREMQAFFEQNPEAGAGTVARKQALETAENNIRWMKAHKETLAKWFTDNSPQEG